MGFEIDSERFVLISKDNNPKAFSRRRFFTLRRIITLIMLLKSSYQREINSFCKKLINDDYNIQAVTAGALTQARAKLNPWAFIRLKEVVLEVFYNKADYLKWENFRLLAIDGSTLRLPRSEEIIDKFGLEQKTSTDKGCILARCSMIYDLLNQTTIDAQLDSYRTSEKVLMQRSLRVLTKDDLLLADRNYASIDIIHWLSAIKVNYCFRIKDSGNGCRDVVKEFVCSDKEDQLVQFTYTAKSRKRLQLESDAQSITVRLIKIRKNQETYVLCTSLMDTSLYTAKKMGDLYDKRWGVEEAYKMLKSRVQLEAFSGKTVRSIYQDYHAKILMMTLCATFTFPIEQKVRKEFLTDRTRNKYNQKINRTNALGETKSSLYHFLIRKSYKVTLKIMDFFNFRSRVSIRDKRSFPRRKKTYKSKHHINYKIL